MRGSREAVVVAWQCSSRVPPCGPPRNDSQDCMQGEIIGVAPPSREKTSPCTKNHARKPPNLCNSVRDFFYKLPTSSLVELERFELSSKRGTNLLSTCLSSPSIVGNKQDRSHPLEPYPLEFRLTPEACIRLSPILLHHRIGTLRSNSIRVMSRPHNFCGD